jgi:hypothetical protein
MKTTLLATALFAVLWLNGCADRVVTTPPRSIDPNPRQPNNTLLSTPGPSGTMTNGPFH